MSMKLRSAPPGDAKRVSRLAVSAVVALLVGTGAVVTATAAPGPPTDVKSAQYGSTKPNPNAPTPTGKCGTIAGPNGVKCEKLQIKYKNAKKACAKKPAAARKTCLKKVEANEGKAFRSFEKSHQYKP